MSFGGMHHDPHAEVAARSDALEARLTADPRARLDLMRSLRAALSLAILLVPVAGAQAQGPRDVPIEQDLQRERRIEREIDRNRPPPTDPFVTPDNPDGVVGFDGPPDPMDDGVDDGSPLPPGSPASPY